MHLTHNIYKSLGMGQDTTAIFLDISKYFNKIWHDGLIFKCKHEFFISGSLLFWLKSYLTNRGQKVKIEDVNSNMKTLSAGMSARLSIRAIACFDIHERTWQT